LTENFVKKAAKHIVKEMLYKVAYALIAAEYNATLEELRCNKLDIVAW